MPDQSVCLCDKMTGFTDEDRVRDVFCINASKAFNIVFYHVLVCMLED